MNAHFLVRRQPSFFCVLTWQKRQGSSLGTFISVLIPFMTAPSSWPSHFTKVLFPSTITLRLGFNIWTGMGAGERDTNIQSIAKLRKLCPDLTSSYRHSLSHQSFSLFVPCLNVTSSEMPSLTPLPSMGQGLSFWHSLWLVVIGLFASLLCLVSSYHKNVSCVKPGAGYLVYFLHLLARVMSITKWVLNQRLSQSRYLGTFC